MNTWFRLYNDLLFNEKIQELPEKLFKFWVNLLCIASRHEGILPKTETISFQLRTTDVKVIGTIQRLIDMGLIDRTDNGLMPHNWNKYQYPSDNSSERVKRFRERSSHVTSNVSVTAQTRTDKTQTQKRYNGSALQPFNARDQDGWNPPPLAKGEHLHNCNLNESHVWACCSVVCNAEENKTCPGCLQSDR